jgi:hypothetical protein
VQIARKQLSDYGSKFAPKRYRQPSLLACLCLIVYPTNWTGDEDRMLCQWTVEEERGDVDPAETVRR